MLSDLRLMEGQAKNFPALGLHTQNRSLAYLDNAATTLKPQSVIDALLQYYGEYPANIHRGTYAMSVRASQAFEEARQALHKYFNVEEGTIIFTAGTTHGINMTAASLGRNLSAKDSILLSIFEHHSNLLPWKMLSETRGTTLHQVSIRKNGMLDEADFYRILEEERPTIVALTGMSNVTGYVPDLPNLIQAAHDVGAIVVLDGAQYAGHQHPDLSALDCDVFCCSGHKLYGPTGIGVLYAKSELLEQYQPVHYGGGMIEWVHGTEYKLARLPERLEGGTPHVAGAIGLHAAIEYIETIGLQSIIEHEHRLLQYLVEHLQELDYVRIVGNNEHCTSICSFNVEGVHSHDVGSMLDSLGVAVRVGHHCAQPLVDYWNISGTIRASLAVYNSIADVEKLIEGIQRVHTVLK